MYTEIDTESRQYRHEKSGNQVEAANDDGRDAERPCHTHDEW